MFFNIKAYGKEKMDQYDIRRTSVLSTDQTKT